MRAAFQRFADGIYLKGNSGQGGIMGHVVELPLWQFVLILLFAAVTFASHFLFPSVRWFFRRRLERAVAQLNTRLERPISPFKLARRHDMIQRLSYDPQVARAIDEHARESGERQDVAFQRARKYAREIVPGFSATAYFSFGTRLSKWLARSFYNVEVPIEPELEGVQSDDAVIFVMNHRSNMDYLLVTYLAAKRSALAYAVGEWARHWPLSWLIRSMGAYFIRRKAPDLLYRRVLARYVQMATEGGLTQAIFPEGGLSLSGGPQAARLGLLSYIIDGLEGAEGRDVIFVPVGLNYDRVIEDRLLVQAEVEGVRRFRVRFWVVLHYIGLRFWQRLRRRLVPVGTAAVAFGTPISLREMLNDGKDTEAVGAELMGRVAKVVPILPVPLVAYALLEAGGPLSEAELTTRCEGLIKAAPLDAAAQLLETAEQMTQHGIALLHLRKLIKIEDGTIQISPNEQPIVQFYATSIAHLMTA